MSNNRLGVMHRKPQNDVALLDCTLSIRNKDIRINGIVTEMPENKTYPIVRPKMKYLWILLLLFGLALGGCQTCRVTSVEDATSYNDKGYQTRIAVYKTGLDGRLWGAFLWTHHAQAQAKVGEDWKWIGTLGLSDSPSFSIADNEIYYWRVTDYAAFLKQQNKYH